MPRCNVGYLVAYHTGKLIIGCLFNKPGIYIYISSWGRKGIQFFVLEVLLTAANIGHDTDTIASMAGNMAGACVGAERMRAERDDLWSELEGLEELIELADGLLEIARTR